MSLKTLYARYRLLLLLGLSIVLHLALMWLAPGPYLRATAFVRDGFAPDLAAAPAATAYPNLLPMPQTSFVSSLHVDRAIMVALNRSAQQQPKGENRLPTVLHQVAPEYPYIAMRAKLEGKVWIRVLVDEKGQVERLGKIYGHAAFHESAAEAVKKWTFKPALQAGEPARTWVRVPFSFELD